jgi:hypothetical protein
MKDFRGMKRQRSRNRKPSGNTNNPNRAYESNGPEGTKVRGNAQTIYEKYQQLARDANSSGDRVLAENHLQHAEHYFRLIRQMQPQRPVSEFVQRDPFSNGYDEYDEEFDAEAAPAAEAEGDTGVPGDEPQPGFDDNGNNNSYNGNNGNNGRQRFEQRDRNGNRDRDRDRNGNRDNRDHRDNRNRDQQPQQRSFEPRGNGEDGGDFEGGRRESRRERYERRRNQRLSDQEQSPANGAAPNGGSGYIASTEPLGARPAPAQPDLAFEPPATPQPVIRERPARVKSEPAGDDASHLPAFLRTPAPVAAAPAAEAEDAAAKPKRGRPKRKTEEATEEA